MKGADKMIKALVGIGLVVIILLSIFIWLLVRDHDRIIEVTKDEMNKMPLIFIPGDKMSIAAWGDTLVVMNERDTIYYILMDADRWGF